VAAAAAAASTSGGGGGLPGELWMLAAAQAMAVGTVMVRFVCRHADPVQATGWHMLLGGGMLGAAMVAQPQELAAAAAALPSFTADDAARMAYVSLGGAAGYGVFFSEAARSKGSLAALSSLTFLTPTFAAAFGYLLLHETFTPTQMAGAAVTLGAVFLVNSPAAPKPAPAAAAAPAAARER